MTHGLRQGIPRGGPYVCDHILTAAIDFASLYDMAISRIKSKLIEPLSVNVNRGATGRQRTWSRSRRPGFGDGVTGRALTLPIQRKIA
jgi:hypothetical protein